MTTTRDEARRSAARVPLEVPPTMFGRTMAWYSRRAYGDVLDTGLAMLHNRKVLKAVMGFERRVAGWDALYPNLKTLALMASAARIGISPPAEIGRRVAACTTCSLVTSVETPSTAENCRDRPVYSSHQSGTHPWTWGWAGR